MKDIQDILNNINTNTSNLELLLLNINSVKFNTLLKILCNKKNTHSVILNKTFYDDDNTNIYLLQHYSKDGDILLNSYKYRNIKDSFNFKLQKNGKLIDYAQLIHYESISMSDSDSLSQLYDAGLFNENKILKIDQTIVLLEFGVQLVLESVEELVNEETTNYYNAYIDFTNIIKTGKKYKLFNLINKYKSKLNFYLNIENFVKERLQSLFKIKYIRELNKILNKPATLQKDDMKKLSMYYTVTDKADGERHLMIIDKYGKLIFVNNRFEIMGISDGIVSNLTDCVFDGEYLSESDNDTNSELFLIFDILQYKNKSMLNKKFIERLKYINNCSNKLSGPKNNGKTHTLLYDKKVNIQIKMFYMLKDFLLGLTHMATDIDTTEEILSYPFLNTIPQNKYSEFMENYWVNRDKKFSYYLDGLIFTPLNGMYIPLDRSFLIYKWKHEHTIDVRIIQDKEDDLIWLFDVSKNKSEIKLVDKLSYDERLNDDEASNNLALSDGDIVEFIWSDKQKQFIPLRIRYDKIVPNAELTVKSVVNAINDNITYNELFKIQNIEKINFGDIFYQERNLSKKERDASSDIALKKFHNYIKSEIIKEQQYLNKDKINTLLDLACGKGGDLRKWISTGIKTVLACDISQTALDEFNNRINSLTNEQKGKINITLIATDSTEDLISGKAGITDKDKIKLKNYFSIKKGLKFDKIVCNFAISYMFKDKYASTFFNNVASLLSDNGLFVGTFIDGDILDEEFIIKKKKEIIAKNDNGDIFYKINPLEGYKKQDPANKILVSRPGIGGWSNPIPEPIVYINQILESSKKVGLNSVDIINFEEYYDKFIKLKGNKFKMSNGEKKISFLHKVFLISF